MVDAALVPSSSSFPHCLNGAVRAGPLYICAGSATVPSHRAPEVRIPDPADHLCSRPTGGNTAEPDHHHLRCVLLVPGLVALPELQPLVLGLGGGASILRPPPPLQPTLPAGG